MPSTVIQTDAAVDPCSLKKAYTVPDDPIHGVTRHQLTVVLGSSNLKVMSGCGGWQGMLNGQPFMILPADPGSVRRPKEWAFFVKEKTGRVIGEIVKHVKKCHKSTKNGSPGSSESRRTRRKRGGNAKRRKTAK